MPKCAKRTSAKRSSAKRSFTEKHCPASTLSLYED